MATRAVYSFKDYDNIFYVYKHWDGSPNTAIQFIKNGIAFGQHTSSFEASDLATSFIASNKKGAGDIYLTHHYGDHGDIEYRYEIYGENGSIKVDVYQKIWSESYFKQLQTITLN